MFIVFFSIYLNHHQAPFSDELYKQTGGNFSFVEMEECPESFKKNGYPEIDRPYVVRAWTGDAARREAERLAVDADVAIFGAASIEMEVLRAKRTGKLSFEASERWLKRGLLNLLSPHLLKNQFYYHTLFYKKPIYKLCSSAYAAGDQYRLRSFRNRCYKWGYFTAVDKNLQIEQKIKEDAGRDKTNILWCARFLKWKHPELPVQMAARLKAKGYSFKLNMFGCGDRLAPTQALAARLKVSDVVDFCGNLPNADILAAMRRHDIFLMTSDRREGWGAVVNEAMGNGCVPVASDAAGATPFLIDDEKNGCIFASGRSDALTAKVESLLNDKEERLRLAAAAYRTIRDIWSPENAAKNLLLLIHDLQQGKDSSIMQGPCSKAYPL